MRAAGFHEILMRFVADFVERLQTVRRESGRYDRNLFALFTQFIDGFVRIGLKPLFRAKARLERDL